jgi:hypothetical protein
MRLPFHLFQVQSPLPMISRKKRIRSGLSARLCGSEHSPARSRRRAAEKCLYAQRGDILIDDWEKYRHVWEASGGV